MPENELTLYWDASQRLHSPTTEEEAAEDLETMAHATEWPLLRATINKTLAAVPRMEAVCGF